MFSLLKKTIYDFDPPAFGLDLSDLSVKLTMLKREGKYLGLASFGKRNVPPGLIVGGEVRDFAKAAVLLKDLFNNVGGEKLSTLFSVCSLPEEKAFVRVIQLPLMKKEEAAEAVRWEAENNIPMPLEEVYLDWQIIASPQEKIDHMDVLIVAIPRFIVDSYLKLFREVGVTPRVFEVESAAIARSVLEDSFVSEPVFIIDLGETRSSFIIFSGHTLRYTSSIEISGRGFNDAISRELKISLEEAEAKKIQLGLLRDKDGGRVFESLVPILTDLVEQVRNHIQFYSEHTQHEHQKSQESEGLKKISKILLCGGGANLQGLDSFLTLELKIPVERANPWINILKPPLREVPAISYPESLSYSTALGLALRGIQRF